MAKLKTLVLPVLLAGVLAGCGSTVQLGQGGAAAQDGLNDLGGLSGVTPAPDTTASQSIDATSTPSGAAPSSVLPGSSEGSAATTGPTDGSSTSSTTTANVPGVTPTTVMIGYPTENNSSGLISSLGIAGADFGNLTAQVQAVTADINSRGGLAGHKIVLVPHDFDATQASSDPSAAGEGACNDWLEDHHVFGVIDTAIGIATPEIRTCTSKANVPLIANGDNDDADYVADPLLASPSTMTVDKYLPGLVSRLVAQGFFGKWNALGGNPGSSPVKIAAQSFDDANGQHYITVLRKALASHGLTLDDVESHSTNIANNAASTSAAVLKFKAEGITHIFNANLLFYEGAAQQGYHPRYAVDDTINTVQLLAQNVGKNELHGAMGAGYEPMTEVPGATAPGPATSHCLSVMQKAGQSTTEQFTREVMASVCDQFYLAEKIFDASGVLSAAGFKSGLAKIGTSFQSALTYQPSFTSSRHYGANELRDYVYDDSCGCFQFPSSKTYPV